MTEVKNSIKTITHNEWERKSEICDPISDGNSLRLMGATNNKTMMATKNAINKNAIMNKSTLSQPSFINGFLSEVLFIVFIFALLN